jgi:hyperosmotically inducible periplasmic protein
MRRLFSLLVLLVLVGGALYVWRGRPAAVPVNAEGGDRDLGGQARAFGAEARDKLDGVGQALRDLKVTASVKTALGLNRSLRPYSIDVSTQNQVVTLRGRVDGEELRARAEAVAAAVPDVTRVLSQLGGTSGTPAPAPAERTLGESFDDHSLEMQVRLALSLNQNLKGTDITVQAYRGQVTLSGDAASPAQRELALQIARDTASVGSVLDSIRVGGASSAAPTAAPASARAGASNGDRAAAAQRALDFNPYLNGFNLQVREEGGRLLLQGRVRTPVEKDLAGLLSREAAGAPVENALEVLASTP